MTQGYIYTVVGSTSGYSGYTGDGGPGGAVQLDSPRFVAVDPYGDLFLSDSGNNAVRELKANSDPTTVLTAGDIYSVAGNSLPGDANDGSQGTSSELDNPRGVAIDGNGNVYIADTMNSRVQEVPAISGLQWGMNMTAGDIYTIAGSPSGAQGYSGDGGVATSALLDHPEGIAIDPSGNIFIADTGNNRVQEIAATAHNQWGQSMTAGDIYTVAGSSTGQAGSGGDGGSATSAYLNGPEAVAVNTYGDLFIADTGNNRVEEVGASTQTVTFGYTGAVQSWTVPSGFEGTSVQVSVIGGGGGYSTGSGVRPGAGGGTGAVVVATVEVTAGGTLGTYIGAVGGVANGQPGGSGGWGYHSGGAGGTGGDQGQWGGGGGGGSSALLAGSTLLIEAGGGGGGGNFYWAKSISSGDGGTPNGGSGSLDLSNAAGPVYTSPGGTQIADGWGLEQQNGYAGQNGANFYCYNCDPPSTVYYGGAGGGGGGYYGASGGAAEGYNGPNGGSMGAGGGGGGSSWVEPSATNVSYSTQPTPANGSVSISYTVQNAGLINTIAGSAGGTAGLSGIGGPATSALLRAPAGLAVFTRNWVAGQQPVPGDLYISGNNMVEEIPGVSGSQWGQQMTLGDIYDVAGYSLGSDGLGGDQGPATNALLHDPTGIAVDGSGNIYIADTANNRIQEVAALTGTQWGQSMTQGDIYTISGSSIGLPGYSGDGGPGTSALMYQPQAVAVDVEGDLYFADSVDNVVREALSYNNILAPGAPTLPKEAQGGTNPSEPNDPQPNFSANDVRGTGVSVNAATGELDVNVEDSAVPGRGVPLMFTRTYSSTGAASATGPGPLGWGWTCSYCMGIFPDPTYGSSVMDVVQENGSVLRFLHTQTGAWATAQRGQATLVQEGGGWQFNRGGTELFNFNASGQLTSEQDLNGYSTTFSYNGSGQLTAISDPAGRSISIAYYPDGLIQSVTDPAGRTTSYTYDSAYNLVQVTDVGGGVTTYAYNSSHELTSVTEPLSPAPQAAQYNYNSAGQVTSQSDPLGRSTQWSYGLDAAGSGTVTITDARNYQTEETLSDGEPTYITDGYGTPQASTTQYIYYPNSDGSESVTTAYGTAEAATSTYTYNAADDLVQKSGPQPEGTWTWTYNSLNEVTSAQSPLEASAGEESTYSYDSAGNLLSSSVPLPTPGTDGWSGQSATTTYNYGSGCSTSGANGCYVGDVSSVVDAAGDKAAYTYDAYGDETSVTTAAGTAQAATTGYAYNNIGEMTCSVEPNETNAGVSCPQSGWALGTTSYTYDKYGDLTVEENPAGYTTAAAYDDLGERTCMVDAVEYSAGVRCPSAGGSWVSGTTAYSYDADSELTQTTYPNGTTAEDYYDAGGNVIKSVDQGGNATEYAHDPLGRQFCELDPVALASGATCPASAPGPLAAGTSTAPGATITAYGPNDEKASVTTPLGYTTAYSYFPDGQLETVNEPNGSALSYTYDQDGNQVSATDMGGNTTNYAYDFLDQLQNVVDPLGNETTYSYDELGRKSCSADAAQVAKGVSCPSSFGAPWVAGTTGFSYNAVGQVTQATRPDGTSIYYSYDRDGNKVAYKDGNGNSWAYSYNNLDQLTSQSDPKSRMTTYSYDPDGRQSTLTNADGQTTTNSYNLVGQPTSTTYSDGEAWEAYAYYTSGPETGLLQAVSDASGGTTYSYDADARPTSITLSPTSGGTEQLSYSYDADGELVSRAYPNGKAVSYSYNSMGQETSLSDWLGNTTSFGYDTAGRLSTTTLPNGIVEATSYDKDSQVSSITDTSGSASVGSFSYSRNPDEEVVSETDTGTPGTSSHSYSYDNMRRVTSDNSSGFTYDSASHLTTGPGGAAQAFDAAGQLCWSMANPPSGSSCSSAPAGATTYSFNNEGERTQTAAPTGTTSYGWNQHGELTSVSSGSSSVGYTYNAQGLLAARTQNGSSPANFVWDPVGGANPLLVDDGTNYYIYGPDSLPTEQVSVSSGTPYYYLHDQLGSTRLLTSSTGTVAGSWSYNAWGQPVAKGGGGGNAAISLVGSLAKGSGTTLSVSPQAVGDLMVLTVATNNSTPPTVSSVSGGGVSTWTLDKRLTDTNSSGYDAEIWSGVVTSTGASTISVNVGGYSNGNDLTAQELSAGPGTTWTITSAGSVASDGSPWDYPSLTASGPGQLYYGFAVTNNNSWNTLSGGGTPGFTFTSTGLGGGTLIAYDANVSGTVQPTGTDNGGSYQDAVGIMVAATSGGPTATTPLLWGGQYYDSTTGLYYMRARWYDPSTGEFLSVDPDFTQTLDAYGYADDSPIDAADPSGLCTASLQDWQSCEYSSASSQHASQKAIAEVVSVATGITGVAEGASTVISAAPAAVSAVVSAGAPSISSSVGYQPEDVKGNQAAGKAAEGLVTTAINNVSEEDPNVREVGEQVRVRFNTGEVDAEGNEIWKTTVIDNLVEVDGRLVLVEVKSSLTARLTANQRLFWRQYFRGRLGGSNAEFTGSRAKAAGVEGTFLGEEFKTKNAAGQEVNVEAGMDMVRLIRVDVAPTESLDQVESFVVGDQIIGVAQGPAQAGQEPVPACDPNDPPSCEGEEGKAARVY